MEYSTEWPAEATAGKIRERSTRCTRRQEPGTRRRVLSQYQTGTTVSGVGWLGYTGKSKMATVLRKWRCIYACREAWLYIAIITVTACVPERMNILAQLVRTRSFFYQASRVHRRKDCPCRAFSDVPSLCTVSLLSSFMPKKSWNLESFMYLYICCTLLRFSQTTTSAAAAV